MRDNGELNKARVASLVQQHVVQLQVSIDDASIVQVKEADGDLGGVETARTQSNLADLAYMYVHVRVRRLRHDEDKIKEKMEKINN